MSSLVDSLKNSHFIYDFGNGVSEPVHYVNRDSSGRWNLALPYCREETGKYIAGQREESGNIRFYISKSDMNFATIDEMAEWCVQNDRSIVYRLSSQSNDSFKVDYETIIGLRSKKPTTANINSFLNAIGLGFVNVTRARKNRRLSGRVDYDRLDLTYSINSSTQNSLRQRNFNLEYYDEKSFHLFSSLLKVLTLHHSDSIVQDNNYFLGLSNFGRDSYDLVLGHFLRSIKTQNCTSNNFDQNSFDPERLGEINKFLFPAQSIMLAHISSQVLNNLDKYQLDPMNPSLYIKSTVVDSWGLKINYTNQGANPIHYGFDYFYCSDYGYSPKRFISGFVRNSPVVEKVKELFQMSVSRMDEWRSNLASRLKRTSS